MQSIIALKDWRFRNTNDAVATPMPGAPRPRPLRVRHVGSSLPNENLQQLLLTGHMNHYRSYNILIQSI